VPSEAYNAFIQCVKEINTATSIEGILEWDQETYMPTKAAETRAAQLALVAGIGHQKLIDEEFGLLLENVEQEQDEDPVVATNVRETRRIYDRKVKLPTSLVQQIATATALARSAWVKARQDSDFPHFAPHLKTLLELKRQVAEKIGYEEEPYDALMDEFEPGVRASDVQRIFDEVKSELVPIVQAIQDAPNQPDTSILEREFPQRNQEAFARKIIGAMGFDFEAGRVDVSAHPFCSGQSPLDVRLTARYNEHFLPMALFGLMHEAGHGLYEQGLGAQHAFTPMGTSVSHGIHESQSRLWENLVGRSRPFWAHYFPQLQKAFPSLADVSLDAWYFAINNVRPSLIRVEADEVTYNTHIMLRFDLERQMIQGKLTVKDVPAAWNAGMEKLLGVTPPSDDQGCLQDIHWSMSVFGYFPSYALGNLYACQFFQAASQAIHELDVKLARGNLEPLRQWLRENIHAHGQHYRANELVERVTGEPLSPQPFIDYLTTKFKPLYGF